jgi:hypothetical protein
MATLSVPYWNVLAPINDPAFTIPPTIWDVVFYGPQKIPFPGLAEIIDCKPKRAILKKKQPSTDGSTPTFIGYDVARFDIELRLFSPLQLQNLQIALAAIFPGKTGGLDSGFIYQASPSGIQAVGLNLSNVTAKSTAPSTIPQAIQVSHPALALAGIDKMIVEGWSPPVMWNNKNDIKVCKFHCWEFRPPVNVQSKTVKNVQTAPPINQNQVPPVTPATPPSQSSAGPSPLIGHGASGSF